ncbi:MAG TPA: hypothetical protein VGN57_15850 [Pirellulaceae bacterium]|jgi:hypothetical protein|nr:hypothetical protein [Pirellulaceae bacterium]
MTRAGLPLSIALASLFAFATADATRAQTGPYWAGSLKIVKAEAKRYRTISNRVQSHSASALGVIEAPSGEAFLAIHLDVVPVLAKDANGAVSCFAKCEAIFVDVEGKPLYAIGTLTPDGRFTTGWAVAEYEFYDADVEFPRGLDPLFLVPATAKAVTLTIGGMQRKFALDEPIGETCDAAASLGGKVVQTRALEELNREHSLGRLALSREFVEKIRTATGRYVAVTLQATPQGRNDASGRFRAVQEDFGVLLGKQVYVDPIGKLEGEWLATYFAEFVSHPDAQGRFPAVEQTIVFPIPGNVKTGKLLYLGQPVADLQFGP